MEFIYDLADDDWKLRKKVEKLLANLEPTGNS
jgi:hypothetical protein